jgi:spore coat protein U-like protein
MPTFSNLIRRWAIAAALPCALFATDAFAQQSATVDIFVDLTVRDGCVVNGSTSPSSLLTFGAIQNPAALFGDVTAQGQPIEVRCNVDSTSATFQIDAGNNDSGGVHRLAQNQLIVVGGGTPPPPRFINYHVYARPGDTSSVYLIGTPIPIGGGVLGGSPPGVIRAGVPFNITLYGSILNADIREAVASNYTDTLRGVLTF